MTNVVEFEVAHETEDIPETGVQEGVMKDIDGSIVKEKQSPL